MLRYISTASPQRDFAAGRQRTGPEGSGQAAARRKRAKARGAPDARVSFLPAPCRFQEEQAPAFPARASARLYRPWSLPRAPSGPAARGGWERMLAETVQPPGTAVRGSSGARRVSGILRANAAKQPDSAGRNPRAGLHKPAQDLDALPAVLCLDRHAAACHRARCRRWLACSAPWADAAVAAMALRLSPANEPCRGIAWQRPAGRPCAAAPPPAGRGAGGVCVTVSERERRAARYAGSEPHWPLPAGFRSAGTLKTDAPAP